jgi:alkanesulfonate monooxygenase SsuD/methylene tetrahydromethanopterin reductase-like flavin-dependent oxidoreductase (luciferase family)
LPIGNPLGHLREFVTVVKGLLSGAQTDFEGKHFNVHAKLNYGAQVPVIISALRATAFELRGRNRRRRGDVALPCFLFARHRAARARAWRRREQAKQRPKLIAHAFLALTSDSTELKQGVDEFLIHYPRLTNYQEMFAAAGYPERGEAPGRPV